MIKSIKSEDATYLTHKEHHDHAHDDDHHSNIDIHKDHNHFEVLRDVSSRLLLWCIGITFTFSLVEGIGGYLIHSIALQSDAVHMLTDAVGLLVALIANNISKKPATHALTYGYGKAEVLGALINSIFTSFLTIGLLFEVVQRFAHPEDVHGATMFIIAGLGFIANLVIVGILNTYSHSLNIKAALLHALGDLLGSLVAIVGGLIIYFTHLSIVDPLLSLIVIVILIVSNYRLVKESIKILMSGVPNHLDYQQIGNDLSAVDGVFGVHDLHIWNISATQVALTAHISTCDPCKWNDVLLECQELLYDKYKIDHVTLQYEFDRDKCRSNGCCSDCE